MTSPAIGSAPPVHGDPIASENEPSANDAARASFAFDADPRGDSPPWHIVALDGVFSAKPDGDGVCFTETRAPAHSELCELAQRVHDRVGRLLRRRGLLHEQPDEEPSEPAPIDACARLSLRLGKLGHVDESGVVYEPDPDEVRFGARAGSPWSGQYEGWNVHAGVMVHKGDAERRERLCRYILRHPLSLQRLSWTKDKPLAYEVKYPRSASRPVPGRPRSSTSPRRRTGTRPEGACRGSGFQLRGLPRAHTTAPPSPTAPPACRDPDGAASRSAAARAGPVFPYNPARNYYFPEGPTHPAPDLCRHPISNIG